MESKPTCETQTTEFEVKFKFPTPENAAIATPAALTETAAKIAQKLMELPENKGKFLRVYLAGKSCDSFLYGVNFDSVREEGDVHWEQAGIPLAMDSGTRDVCLGAQIDFIDDERGQGFLVQNPNEGEFSGKFWKREGPAPKLESPVITKLSPLIVDTEPGTYLYCTCGLTKRGAECDGSHGASGFQPMEVTVAQAARVAWCLCRHSKTLPYCDGTHKALTKS